MLNIQVLGKGLIPRGYGLAPRMKPFKADLNHIGIILQTPGLSINYVNPEDGRLLPLTTKNVKRIWDKYGNWSDKPAAPTAPANPGTGTTETPVGDANTDRAPSQVDKEAEVVKPHEPVTTPPVPPVEPEKPVEQPVTTEETTDAAGKDEKPAEEETKAENPGNTSNGGMRPVLNPEEIARRKQQSEKDRNRNNGHK